MNRFLEQVGSLEPGVGLAVLGDPIEHSLSPVMQNAALAARGLAHRYGRLRVSEAELAEAFRHLRERFLGWNLTLPLKLAALNLVEEVDEDARWLNAINTVVCRQGRLAGFNTDAIGLHRALDEVFGTNWKLTSVAIIGAGGGAGSSAARYLARIGVPALALVNRTPEKLAPLRAALAGLTDLRLYGWDGLPRAVAESRLLINASSLGLDGTPLGWDPGWLQGDHRVFDMVYRRDLTPVVAWARRRGIVAVDGLAMLLYQGAAAFRHWFGEPVPEAEMRRALYTAAGRA
ncbi:MAG: shikimate dehydrogenase [Verrucomicrobia bacterium]|nr:shikimate dehydrogenase [Verrucomicrobiota bacterium]